MANKTTVTAEPGKQELFIIREFDAPRELVFKAYTAPDIYVKWVGPNDLTMTIDKWDCRDGGSYKFTHERGGTNTHSSASITKCSLRSVSSAHLNSTGCPSAATSFSAPPNSKTSAAAAAVSCINLFSSLYRTATEWSSRAWNAV